MYIAVQKIHEFLKSFRVGFSALLSEIFAIFSSASSLAVWVNARVKYQIWYLESPRVKKD